MGMIRLLGGFLLIFGCGMTGIQKSAALKKRRDSLGEILRFLARIAQAIRLSQQEIPDLLEEYLPNGIVPDGRFGIHVSKNLCLNAEDTRLLYDLADQLGMGDVSSQLTLCESYEQLFSVQKQDAQTALAEKQKLYRSFGWILGGIAALFLL